MSNPVNVLLKLLYFQQLVSTLKLRHIPIVTVVSGSFHNTLLAKRIYDFCF